jgi:GNAT superfamily N-acetyltransferase
MSSRSSPPCWTGRPRTLPSCGGCCIPRRLGIDHRERANVHPRKSRWTMISRSSTAGNLSCSVGCADWHWTTRPAGPHGHRGLRRAEGGGHYALSAGAIARVGAPGRIRRNMPDPIPVMVWGRLAVDSAFHGKGVGTGLLRDAVLRTRAAKSGSAPCGGASKLRLAGTSPYASERLRAPIRAAIQRGPGFLSVISYW